MSRAASFSSVTIVIPTYREAQNLPLLFDRIAVMREAEGLDLDVIVMDDDSRDGSDRLVATRGTHWITLVTRTADRGLSPSVLDGLRRARGALLVVMDADLSHPPERIPAMLARLEEGADFVIGSRYVAGGSTSDDWGFLRWANSRVATLLARPLTSARDPMAGFFALHRTTFERGAEYNPVGYKIGLELIVKCGCERVVETPIHFEDRQLGESKLTLWQQMLYLKHLRRLYTFKYGAWSQLVQFLTVGALGTVVNLGLLTAFLAVGTDASTAVALAIALSMLFNFVLNRRFSFGDSRTAGWIRPLIAFIVACSFGAGINFMVTVAVIQIVPSLPIQVSAVLGIIAATAFNFVASRYLVFRATRIRTPRSTWVEGRQAGEAVDAAKLRGGGTAR